MVGEWSGVADGGGGREEEVVVVEEEEEAAETSHRPLLLLPPLTHTPSHSNGWRRGMVAVGNCMVLRKEEKEGIYPPTWLRNGSIATLSQRE